MWQYGRQDLRHYGVKGMKWGVRRTQEQLDKSHGAVKLNLQMFAKKASSRRTLHLPIKEFAHVMSELQTHITPEQKQMKVIQKPIGDYVYKFENNFNDTYRIIGKRKIPHTMTGLLERINDEKK